MKTYDVIIIGAGAAGLFCASIAGGRGRSVVLLDHAAKIGEKIRISGGGRCNFTNINASPAHYLSQNPHFCKSALKQYTQNDFIALVERHGIPYHEKTLGQLFCDKSAQDIIDMLRLECLDHGVEISMKTQISAVEKPEGQPYRIKTDTASYTAQSLVIATGGLSIPKIGASDFSYKIAKQFGLPMIATRPALVPLTFTDQMKEFCAHLSGLSVDAIVSCGQTSFREGLLFTHRGLSGPSILQISSYWREGREISVNLAPDHDIAAWLIQNKKSQPKQSTIKALSTILPQRLAQALCDQQAADQRLADCADKKLRALGQSINQWQLKPNGTEGYRKAEVTLGGVDTSALSSKTMEVKTQKGLFFIGEALDVTGHLGGYNFQWAWSSAYATGMNV